MEVGATNNIPAFSAIQRQPPRSAKETENKEAIAESAISQSAQEVANRANEDARNAKIDKESFSELVSALNEQAQLLRMQLAFGYSDDIDALYLKVMDAKSGELIRQIPSEEAIKLIARMREMAGLLLEERV